MLVWANLHGGYLLGQVTIVLFMVLEGIKFLHPALGPMPRGATGGSWRPVPWGWVSRFSLPTPTTAPSI
jgi:hypothetical protein